ncbi:DNA cytosine methyltransferase [Phytobacter sp. V91]|uniref:DNA cytosine methyltransferase n=1 Tax=Phytobacter sp. V91 TaxID=3369425 RepID=UPI003F636C5E
MKPAAYYNEIDPFAAARLRAHIAAGRIMAGEVDERSIEDVRPDDLRGFTQVNFFAGIGVWSYAFRLAGWPEDQPIWSGSAPCQPFSQAGKGLGFTDERHLWPSMHWLVGQRRPFVVFGEQSGSSDANDWVDLVQADMEALGYAFGAVAFPSASVGAPHRRDRAYWVAHADSERMEASGQSGARGRIEFANSGDTGWLAHANRVGSQGGVSGRQVASREDIDGSAGFSGANCRPGPVNGFWSDADWLYCRDGKWRPVKPGLEPLVNGAADRVGRIRTTGNAINVHAAAAFVKAYMKGHRYD